MFPKGFAVIIFWVCRENFNYFIITHHKIQLKTTFERTHFNIFSVNFVFGVVSIIVQLVKESTMNIIVFLAQLIKFVTPFLVLILVSAKNQVYSSKW